MSVSNHIIGLLCGFMTLPLAAVAAQERLSAKPGEHGAKVVLMWDTLISLAIVIGILGLSAVFTEWFARRNYYRCRGCLTLNAKRRTVCRQCGEPLP